GRCRPRFFWARGTRTARLSAARMRRSRSARRPSRSPRRARSSASSRASWIAAVWRAYTSHVVTRNARSHTATQWRPLTIDGDLERAQPGGPGPRVVAHFGRVGADRPLGEDAAERPPAAGADGLARRAHAGPAPGA